MAGGEFRDIPPRAAAVLNSLRAVGYDLPTALADIVDNSLAASASRVRIDMRFDGKRSHIRIEDNGHGMGALELETAMRLGSLHPSTTRALTDHGRFGLGLKTASFSQCRRLTVRTRAPEGKLETRSWDLDHIEKINSWALLAGTWDEGSELALGTIPEGSAGTIVLWEKLDHVVDAADSPSAHADFDRKIVETRDHLSMVFHRLLDTPPPLTIELNGVKLEGWDPLFSRHRFTRQLRPALLKVGSSSIQVSPYIIPPENRLTAEEARRAAGPRGWLGHQGLYLYRNRRLLVTGGWMHLAGRDPQCSLARIRIEVDNTLDDVLQIDIRKAKARIPDQIRPQMHQLVDRTRKAAIEAWRSNAATRSGTSQKAEVVPVWHLETIGAKSRLRVNPAHPVLQSVRARLGEHAGELDVLLALLGSSVPVDVFMQMGGAAPASTPAPPSGEQLPPELVTLTQQTVSFMRLQETTPADIQARLSLVEPWSSLSSASLQWLIENVK